MEEAAQVGMLLSITNPSVRLGMLLISASVFDGVLITLIPGTPPLTPRRRPDSRWRSQSLPQWRVTSARVVLFWRRQMNLLQGHP